MGRIFRGTVSREHLRASFGFGQGGRVGGVGSCGAGVKIEKKGWVVVVVTEKENTEIIVDE